MENRTIDINADVGESTHLWPYELDSDILLLDYVSSVNIACGYHAGDAHTMCKLVQEALRRGVAIGAHPSYPDREHFGRKSVAMDPRRIYEHILYQLGSLEAFLKAAGTRLNHVKPHGALYNDACSDPELSRAIATAVYDFDPGLRLVGLSKSLLLETGENLGLKVTHEVFADRSYQGDGRLTPRTQPGAVLTDAYEAVRQVLQMLQAGTVMAANGKTVAVQADSVCLHSDNGEAIRIAEVLQLKLAEMKIFIKPLLR